MPIDPHNSSKFPEDRDALVETLNAGLAKAAAVRAAARQSDVDRADRARLRAFQAERLARTYADLLASPRYGPAAAFFLSDLYGTKERAARDETVNKVVPILARMLPAGAVHALAIAIWLDALSEELDLAMVHALREEGGLEGLDAARYASAWRRCGRSPERERQIELIGEVGQVLDRLTKMTSVGVALRLMRGPARAAGFGRVQDFLERGFRAFAHMGDATESLATLRARETAIAARLFTGEPTEPA
jgi:hypothetical protein